MAITASTAPHGWSGRSSVGAMTATGRSRPITFGSRLEYLYGIMFAQHNPRTFRIDGRYAFRRMFALCAPARRVSPSTYSGTLCGGATLTLCFDMCH
jgi:hypothetical protein